MKWPEDWDKPSEGNDILCKSFHSSVWKDEDGFTLNYRYFTPAKRTHATGGHEKYPLVLYLHGADAFGHDNSLQLEMHDIGTMFARKDWQDVHPCYILAPQCAMEQHWSRKDVGDHVQHFVEHFLSSYRDADRSRLYIYGYSAGGLGALNILKRHEGFYAAALPICGATGGDKLLNLLKTPMWMIHAADDRIVKASYGNPGIGSKFYLGSRDIYEVLQENSVPHMELLYTEFPEGWLKKFLGVNAHCSWVAVSDPILGKSYRDWLFKQQKKSSKTTYYMLR